MATPTRTPLLVLTDGFLLRLIASFQRGLPRDLVELARTQPNSTLLQLVVQRRSQALLTRIYRLSVEQPEYFNGLPRLSWNGAWLTAVRWQWFSAARWIERRPGLATNETPEEIWRVLLRAPASRLRFALKSRPDLPSHLTAEQVVHGVLLGRVRVFQALDELVPAVPYTVAAVRSAVSAGRLSMVQHLHGHNIDGWTTGLMDRAAEKGRLEVVRFLHEQRTEGCTTAAMDMAAANGHIDVLQFLHEHRTEGCTRQALNAAARKNDMAIVRFLCENRTEGCIEEALEIAVSEGHLEVVGYLIERLHGCCDVGLLEKATSSAVVRLLVIICFKNHRSALENQPMRTGIRFEHCSTNTQTNRNATSLSQPLPRMAK